MADDFFVDKDDKWVDTADDFWAGQGIILLGVKGAILEHVAQRINTFKLHEIGNVALQSAA